MTLKFDHAIIAVNDLESAMADYKALGFNPIFGGEHVGGTTHNALIYFADGSYLELIAPTGKLPQEGGADFRSMLEKGEGLVGYAFVSDDLEADSAAMRQRELTVTQVQQGGRTRSDGVELRWQSVGIEGSWSPFFIEDLTPRNQRVLDDMESTTQPNGIIGVSGVHIIVNHDLARRYERIMGESASEYNINGVKIHLLPPDNDELQGYADVRGEAPFALFLKGEAGLTFHLEQTHNARLFVG